MDEAAQTHGHSMKDALRRIQIFAQLSNEDLAQLEKVGEVLSFDAGAVLMREGDPGDRALVVLEGRVSVTRGGRELITRGPGDCLGELALIDPAPRSATVTALEAVRAVSLHAGDFQNLLSYPAFIKGLLQALSGKVREGDVAIGRAIERLQRVQALKDDLFSLIVHDLRNPLSNIRAAISLLATSGLADGDPANRRVIDAASNSAGYMQRLLEEVLDVRLLEEGELKLERSDCSLRGLCGEAAEALRTLASARRVELAVEGEDVVMPLDARLVRRTIENFLSNALKYAPARSTVTIHIGLPGDSVELDVIDRGPGVPRHLRAAILEKFGSVELLGSGQRRGYGLGLHLASLVAAAHGGAISVHDHPDGGAIFRLTLPR